MLIHQHLNVNALTLSDSDVQDHNYINNGKSFHKFCSKNVIHLQLVLIIILYSTFTIKIL